MTKNEDQCYDFELESKYFICYYNQFSLFYPWYSITYKFHGNKILSNQLERHSEKCSEKVCTMQNDRKMTECDVETRICLTI